MSKNNVELPLISIVITTKNEEKNIENCLKSIKTQSYPREKMEVIVVDNASTDKTREISLKYTDKVYDKGPERSAQRNYGMIDKANGDYVIYLDADMILSPVLIAACVDYSTRTHFMALHIKEIILGTSFWSKVRRFERGFYDGTVVDGARFFQKDAFVKVRGFDEELFVVGSGEDWDLDKKIKKIGQIGLLPSDYGCGHVERWQLLDFIRFQGVDPDEHSSVIYHNEVQFSMRNYLRKKSYYTKGFKGYTKKWGKNDPDIKRQFGVYYRYFGIFMEDRKWGKLLAHPLLTSGMYLLRFFVGLNYLMNKYRKVV